MKRIITSIFVAAALLCTAAPAFAVVPADNTIALSTVIQDGKKCYLYIAEKGESIFGIAAKYHWDEETLARFNPGLETTMKGQRVYYPCPEEKPAAQPARMASPKPSGSQPSIATVSADDLHLKSELYTVPRTMTVTQAAVENRMPLVDLFRINPGLGVDSVEAGTRLKVMPGLDMRHKELRQVTERKQVSSTTYKAKKNDTWEKIQGSFTKKKKARFTVDELRKANPGVTLAKGVVISIPDYRDTLVNKYVPVRDAREDLQQGVRELYAEAHGRKTSNMSADGTYNLNISVLVSGNDAKDRRRDMEFLKGFMLALDGKKFPGYDITLHGIDIADYGNLQKVIDSGKLANSDMVIYPADSDFPVNLADYCTSRDIMFLNVFDAKTDVADASAWGVQLLPPSAYFYDRASDFLSRVMNDRTFIFIDFDDNGDGDSMSAAMMNRLKDVGINKIVLLPDADALAEYDFNSALSYTVVSDASRQAEIMETFEVLEKVVDKYPNMPLSIVGRATWIVNASRYEKLLQKLDTYIPARFYYDSDAGASKDFNAKFRSMYSAAPLNTMPMYSAMGYDVANYFIDTFVKTDGDFNRSEQDEAALQLDFRPERSEPWKGMMNRRVYLLHFTPFMTTDKIGL